MLTSGNVTFKWCCFLASRMYFFGDPAKGLPEGGGGGVGGTPVYKPNWVCAAPSGGVFAP